MRVRFVIVPFINGTLQLFAQDGKINIVMKRTWRHLCFGACGMVYCGNVNKPSKTKDCTFNAGNPVCIRLCWNECSS